MQNNKTISREQFQGILDGRPNRKSDGSDIPKWVNQFTSNGYVIEGVNDQAKPTESNKPSFLDNLKSSVQNTANETGEANQKAVSNYKEGNTNLLSTAANVASNEALGFTKGLMAPISAGIESATQSDTFQNIANTPVGEAAQNIVGAYDKNVQPTVDQAKQVYDKNVPENAKESFRTSGNLLGTALNLEGGIQSAKGAVDTAANGVNLAKKSTATLGTAVSDATQGIKAAVKDTVNGLVPEDSVKLTQLGNKILPFDKVKDVKGFESADDALTRKQGNIDKAFKNISDNPLVMDDKGNIVKSPIKATEGITNYTTLDEANKLNKKDTFSQMSKMMSEGDVVKFREELTQPVLDEIESLGKQFKKTFVKDKKSSIQGKIDELKDIRDNLGTLGIDDIYEYVKDLGEQSKLVPGSANMFKAIQARITGNKLNDVLDNVLEKVTDKSGNLQGFKDLKSQYAAHRSIEKQLTEKAVREIQDIPGLKESLANIGLNMEMLRALSMGDLASLGVTISGKVGSEIFKRLNSPQAAIKKYFKMLENQSLDSQAINPPSTNAAINSNIIPDSLPQTKKITSGKLK